MTCVCEPFVLRTFEIIIKEDLVSRLEMVFCCFRKSRGEDGCERRDSVQEESLGRSESAGESRMPKMSLNKSEEEKLRISARSLRGSEL